MHNGWTRTKAKQDFGQFAPVEKKAKDDTCQMGNFYPLYLESLILIMEPDHGIFRSLSKRKANDRTSKDFKQGHRLDTVQQYSPSWIVELIPPLGHRPTYQALPSLQIYRSHNQSYQELGKRVSPLPHIRAIDMRPSQRVHSNFARGGHRVTGGYLASARNIQAC